MIVHFPDGTVVTACSLAERRVINPDRDFGLYMDEAWLPTWSAEMIDWQDFGLPVNPGAALTSIVAAFERAKRLEWVEIGCVGGRGRTGTVLACMAVLAGVKGEDAVRWVREHYYADAVETEEQEGWVRWFASQVGKNRIRDRR